MERGKDMCKTRYGTSNEGWNDKFGSAMVKHLDFYRSDHRPLMLSLDPISVGPVGPKVLRFE